MPPLTGPRGVSRIHRQIFKLPFLLCFIITFYAGDPFSSNLHCGVSTPVWGASAAAIPEPKVTVMLLLSIFLFLGTCFIFSIFKSDERLRGELTAILQEEARQKQEQLLKQGQLPQPDHVRQARQLAAAPPPHARRRHHVAKDVYQTLEIVPRWNHNGSS